MKHNQKGRKFFLLSLLLTLYILVAAYSYVNAVSKDIANSVFRLHVIANSDKKDDQDIKYKVRDSLLHYMNDIAKNATSKEDAIQIAKDHQSDFQKIAENTIQENGCSYPVKIAIGNFSFPTKNYGDISLPAGSYDALRVEIGEAKGRNWWCVMFPPLCFVDVSSGIVPAESKETIKENLSEEEYSLIADTSSKEIQFKFKLIEFLQNVNIFTAKQ